MSNHLVVHIGKQFKTNPPYREQPWPQMPAFSKCPTRVSFHKGSKSQVAFIVICQDSILGGHFKYNIWILVILRPTSMIEEVKAGDD